VARRYRRLVVSPEVHAKLMELKERTGAWSVDEVIRRLLSGAQQPPPRGAGPRSEVEAGARPAEPAAPAAPPEPAPAPQPPRAPPSEVAAIRELAWSVASWSDVRDVLSEELGFEVPPDPSQLTAEQAAKVREALRALAAPLPPVAEARVRWLLTALAKRLRASPSEVADRFGLPESPQALRVYHLRVLELALQRLRAGGG
jgi:hypothetical protein